MSWRVVVISHSAKLEYKMEYLLVRQEEITRIHLSEIGVLIIESTAVSITASLLAELVKHKIKVIFCDERRNPLSELIGYYGSHDTSDKVRSQVNWPAEIKQRVWTEIVREKISKQRDFLSDLAKPIEASLLTGYIQEIQPGDVTNREGHAAKVYFNAIFGKDFSRTAEIPWNAALNYGYSILLSVFNREITANGYITQLGLFHANMFNPFNLGSDLMEPFRILMDRAVYALKPEKFEHAEKMLMIDVLNEEVWVENRKNVVNAAIRLYCRSVFEALEAQDISLLRFYRREGGV